MLCRKLQSDTWKKEKEIGKIPEKYPNFNWILTNNKVIYKYLKDLTD